MRFLRGHMVQEINLHDLWASVLPDKPPLSTRDGQTVDVLSPGRRTSGPGPDFRGCILDVDGEIWTGDAEIHVDERDWDHHGHSLDPAFQDLLLHICFRPADRDVAPEYIKRTVILDQQKTLEELTKEKDNLVFERRSLCPAGRSVQDQPQRVKELIGGLEDQGRERFSRRCEEVRGRLRKASHRRHVFAKLLLECMGFHRNRTPAERLGEQLNVDWFRRELHDYPDPKTTQRAGESWMLKRAGFLSRGQCSGLFDDSGAWRFYREQLMCFNGSERHGLDVSWDRSGTRPVNSPYRRLAGFVVLFRRFLVQQTVYQTEELFMQHVMDLAMADQTDRPSTGQHLVKPMTVGEEDVDSYWNRHSSPGQPLSQPAGLVGTHRAGVLWINGIAPYFKVLAEEKNLSKLREGIDTLNTMTPLPVGDYRVNRVLQFLFKTHSDEVPLSLFIDQGMHALYKGFCRFGDVGCSRCEIRSAVCSGEEAINLNGKSQERLRIQGSY